MEKKDPELIAWFSALTQSSMGKVLINKTERETIYLHGLKNCILQSAQSALHWPWALGAEETSRIFRSKHSALLWKMRRCSTNLMALPMVLRIIIKQLLKHWTIFCLSHNAEQERKSLSGSRDEVIKLKAQVPFFLLCDLFLITMKAGFLQICENKIQV